MTLDILRLFLQRFLRVCGQDSLRVLDHLAYRYMAALRVLHHHQLPQLQSRDLATLRALEHLIVALVLLDQPILSRNRNVVRSFVLLLHGTIRNKALLVEQTLIRSLMLLRSLARKEVFLIPVMGAQLL